MDRKRTDLDRRVMERTLELQDARDELAETVSRLREAKTIQDRLFANVNHEIRTPLSLISLGIDDVLARFGDNLDERAHSSLSIARGGVASLVRLVDELLLVAASREGKLSLQRSSLDLALVVQRCLHAHSTLAEQENNILVYEGPETLRGVVDHAALERILNNLLSNSLKFCRKSTITVSLDTDESDILVKVADEGPGIPELFKEQIFERFEQGEIGALRRRGSGIGLAIVKELVELHGGAVTVMNGEPAGAVFCLRLPRQPPNHAPKASTSGSFVAFPPKPSANEVSEDHEFASFAVDEGAPLILIAEDEHDLRRVLGFSLTQNGFRVATAPNGAMALKLAVSLRPDLLITDINMPEMDGYKLIEELRNEPGTGFLPVVILSAYGTTRDVVKGLDRGAVDYVRKPVQTEELVSRVHAQLRWREMAIQLHEQEKLSSLATLSVGLAHELRNPANVLVNGLSLLGDRLELPEGSSARALLEAVNDAGRHLAEVSKHLLGLDRTSLPTSHVSITEVIERAERIVVEKLQHVRYQRSVPPCATRGQEALLAQVFVNLLDNAVQACGHGGSVELTAMLEEKRILIRVHDSGPGVPPELRRKIFEPFFTTKAQGRGTGLGLTTAKRIVLDAGGDLFVESSQPSVITVSLPRAQLKISG